MNIKNKKIIALIVGIAAGVTIVGTLLYGPINKAENEHVGVVSTLYNIKDNTIMDKQALLDTQDKMMKLNEDKGKTIKIDKIIEEMEKEDYKDLSKINDNVKQLDKLNKEIDNMISIYNEDENMKKDMTIYNAMLDIEATNNLIDDLMNQYNIEFSPEFNEAIKKFPVNLVSKNKGWFEVDKFSSVN